MWLVVVVGLVAVVVVWFVVVVWLVVVFHVDVSSRAVVVEMVVVVVVHSLVLSGRGPAALLRGISPLEGPGCMRDRDSYRPA